MTPVTPFPRCFVAPARSLILACALVLGVGALKAAGTDPSVGWKTYLSTYDKLPADLQPHFIGFTFSYPPSFVVQPQQEGIFVVVHKTAANGDEAASFTVSWYQMDTADSRKEDYDTLDGLGKAWPKQYPDLRCAEITTFTGKVNGIPATSRTWEFRTADAKHAFVSAARSILLHPQGKTRGVRIDLFATSAEPKLRSAAGLGKDDDLAAMLATFKFVETETPAETTPRKPATDDDNPYAIILAAVQWLRLLDPAKPEQSFAAGGSAFRKEITLETWQKSIGAMEKEFGTLVSRDDNVSLETVTKTAEGEKETVKRVLKIKSKFTKTPAIESITLTKENGEWKVADYSIEKKLP